MSAANRRVPLLQLVGVAAFYVASANYLLSQVVETCTQNSPDSLWAIILSIPLYALAVPIFALRSRRLSFYAVLPALLLSAFCAVRSLVFAVGWVAFDISACSFITGDDHWEPAGTENALASLHGVTASILSACLLFIFIRAWRSRRLLRSH